MKWYVGDLNGILADLKEKIGPSNLTSPRNANVWVTFQDCQGSYQDLIVTAKKMGVAPPVYTVQHGRFASYDYGPPNSFPLAADKFLCWGKKDYDHMVELGFKDRVEIVGCPLNAWIKPKVEHKEKVVLFVPVNTGKEEPENIAVYYELLKHKYHKAQVKVLDARQVLKDKWGFNNKPHVSFNELGVDFDVVAKLLPWHDKNLYHGKTLGGYQDSPNNNKLVFELLRNVDMVVGLDEGCTEVFAYANDVPVVVVKGFQYRQHRYDGKEWKYVTCDPKPSKAATHVDLKDLAEAINYGLAHPEHLRKERAEEAEAHMGLSYGDATANIYNLIRKDMSLRETKTLR